MNKDKKNYATKMCQLSCHSPLLWLQRYEIKLKVGS